MQLTLWCEFPGEVRQDGPSLAHLEPDRKVPGGCNGHISTLAVESASQSHLTKGRGARHGPR